MHIFHSFFYVLIYPLKCLANTDDTNFYRLSLIHITHIHKHIEQSSVQHTQYFGCCWEWSVLPAITFVQSLQICSLCLCLVGDRPPIGFDRVVHVCVVVQYLAGMQFGSQTPNHFNITSLLIFFFAFRRHQYWWYFARKRWWRRKKANWKIFVWTKNVAKRCQSVLMPEC